MLFCCPTFPQTSDISHRCRRGCWLHELFLQVTLTTLQSGAVSGLSQCFGVRTEFFPDLAVWRLLLSLVRPPEHSHHSRTLRSLALSCFLPSLRCSSEFFHLCSRSPLFGCGTLAGVFSLCFVPLEETVSSGKPQQGLQLGFPLNLQEFLCSWPMHISQGLWSPTHVHAFYQLKHQKKQIPAYSHISEGHRLLGHACISRILPCSWTFPRASRAPGVQEQPLTARRRSLCSAPAAAFAHHLHFVFAASLQANSRYPACHRLTCCDIP